MVVGVTEIELSVGAVVLVLPDPPQAVIIVMAMSGSEAVKNRRTRQNAPVVRCDSACVMQETPLIAYVRDQSSAFSAGF
jgi:hypothetical protein